MMNTTDYSDAETTLRNGGRTFHWARRFLGAGIGHDAARLYAFCRLLDDLADGDIDGGPDRLLVIRDGLKSGRSNDPDLAAFLPFMEDRGIPRDALDALIEGLLQDQQEVLLTTEAELHQYCYRVAGTVGLMMCPILGVRDRAAQAHAIDLGIAMQMTNIARDILEDATMGRRYLPGAWVRGIRPVAIVAAAKSGDERVINRVAQAARRLVGQADNYYQSGISGLGYLPVRAHLAILIAAVAYRQIGVQLTRRGCRWDQGRQVTSTVTKLRVSVMALPRMLARVMPAAPHQPMLHIGLKGLPHVDQ